MYKADVDFSMRPPTAFTPIAEVEAAYETKHFVGIVGRGGILFKHKKLTDVVGYFYTEEDARDWLTLKLKALEQHAQASLSRAKARLAYAEQFKL